MPLINDRKDSRTAHITDTASGQFAVQLYRRRQFSAYSPLLPLQGGPGTALPSGLPAFPACRQHGSIEPAKLFRTNSLTVFELESSHKYISQPISGGLLSSQPLRQLLCITKALIHRRTVEYADEVVAMLTNETMPGGFGGSRFHSLPLLP